MDDLRLGAFAYDGTRIVFQPLTGGVDFGTKDIGIGYNDDATCESKHLKIRDPFPHRRGLGSFHGSENSDAAH
jgi:hypothetical protein